MYFADRSNSGDTIALSGDEWWRPGCKKEAAQCEQKAKQAADLTDVAITASRALMEDEYDNPQISRSLVRVLLWPVCI